MTGHLFHTHHRSQLIQMAFLPGKLFGLWKIHLLEMSQYLAMSSTDKMAGHIIPSSSSHLASNASTERMTATSIFSWTVGPTLSPVQRTWIHGHIPEAWRCWGQSWVPKPIISRKRFRWIPPWTAFSEVARYCKSQPFLMSNVDFILRKIGQLKYLAVTDLTKAFYQIPLAWDSIKYCGVVTPFRGVRLYTRSAKGMTA